MGELFHKFSMKISEIVGSPWAFILAVCLILVWLISGPVFGFSDTWQLVINTGTTILTFLMVFLIQNTQNRDAKAIHLKLDELIRSIEGARDSLVDLEDLSEEDLKKLQEEFMKFRERHAEMKEHLEEATEGLEEVLENRRPDQKETNNNAGNG